MDGFDFFPVNTQPSQTSATGLGHAPAPRAGLEAAAVEAETACRHGLPTVEARRPVQAAADGGARRSLRLVVIVRARPRRTVAARARVVAGVAVQQGVLAILKLPATTTSASMKKKDTKRRSRT